MRACIKYPFSFINKLYNNTELLFDVSRCFASFTEKKKQRPWTATTNAAYVTESPVLKVKLSDNAMQWHGEPGESTSLSCSSESSSKSSRPELISLLLQFPAQRTQAACNCHAHETTRAWRATAFRAPVWYRSMYQSPKPLLLFLLFLAASSTDGTVPAHGPFCE